MSFSSLIIGSHHLSTSSSSMVPELWAFFFLLAWLGFVVLLTALPEDLFCRVTVPLHVGTVSLSSPALSIVAIFVFVVSMGEQ